MPFIKTGEVAYLTYLSEEVICLTYITTMYSDHAICKGRGNIFNIPNFNL